MKRLGDCHLVLQRVLLQVTDASAAQAVADRRAERLVDGLPAAIGAPRPATSSAAIT